MSSNWNSTHAYRHRSEVLVFRLQALVVIRSSHLRHSCRCTYRSLNVLRKASYIKAQAVHWQKTILSTTPATDPSTQSLSVPATGYGGVSPHNCPLLPTIPATQPLMTWHMPSDAPAHAQHCPHHAGCCDQPEYH